MAGVRKLRAIIIEDDIDAVVESLGEAGIAEFIDMHEKLEDWKGVLIPHRISPEAMTKCSKLLSRIEDLFETLGVKPEDLHSEEIPVLKESIADVLANVEQRLEELPIETHTKSLAFVSRIDPFMETLEEKLEHGKIEQVTLEKTVEKTLAELESDLPEIAYLAKTTSLTDHHSLVEKIHAFAIEKKVDVDGTLAEFRSYSMESDRLLGEQLLSLKKLVEASMETIETETKLGEIREGLLTLRKTVEAEKQIPGEQEKFVSKVKTIYFEAWVPEFHVKDAIERIRNATKGNSMVVDEPPASEDNIPVIHNSVPSYLSAFEKLVYAFGSPSSGDINPTYVLAITFPVIFGIMFADVGQGVIFASWILGTCFSS